MTDSIKFVFFNLLSKSVKSKHDFKSFSKRFINVMEFDDKSRIKINILDIKDNITTEQKETKKQGKKTKPKKKQ